MKITDNFETSDNRITEIGLIFASEEQFNKIYEKNHFRELAFNRKFKGFNEADLSPKQIKNKEFWDKLKK